MERIFKRNATFKYCCRALPDLSGGELYKNVTQDNIKNSYERGLELIDLTLQDPKWQGFHELYELRDSLASLYIGKTNPIIVKFFYTWLMNLTKNLNKNP